MIVQKHDDGGVNLNGSVIEGIYNRFAAQFGSAPWSGLPEPLRATIQATLVQARAEQGQRDPSRILYTAAQVAGMLLESADTVRAWCASGKLKAIRPGRCWKIPEQAITEFLDRENGEMRQTLGRRDTRNGGKVMRLPDARSA